MTEISGYVPNRYPEDTHRDDMAPLDALSECWDLWGSGAWIDENAVYNLEEVMGIVAKLLGRV